jgi:hypothetical protein
MVQQLLANVKIVCGSAISVWFIFWSYRRRYELDVKLSDKAKTIRWSIVGPCFVMACLPGQSPWIKLPAIILGEALFCWPNFASHILRLAVLLHLAKSEP